MLAFPGRRADPPIVGLEPKAVVELPPVSENARTSQRPRREP